MKKTPAKKPESKAADKATKPAKSAATKAKNAPAPKPAVAKKSAAQPKKVSAVTGEKKPARLKLTVPKTPATVIVHYDAGWGNTLHLRGEGPGLSWDTGKPLCCVQSGEWVWVAPTVGTIVFKVLHNDKAWSLGENFVAGPGETVTVTPVF